MILGIDGGGTKTAFLLCDNKGNIVAHYTAGPAHYLQIGFDGFRTLISESIQHIAKLAKVKLHDIDFITLGVPGLGESKEDEARIADILEKIIPCPFEAVNDVKLAWAGALACQPGICLLSGTGSMAYAVDAANHDLRCGGWGHGFGDEGSAYWLGIKACEIYSKMSDHRYTRGPLYQIIKTELQLPYDFALINYVLDEKQDTRTRIAQIAQLLAMAANQEDCIALSVFKNAAEELALHVKGILTQFIRKKDESSIPLSYLGGVFNAGSFFLPQLKDALSSYPIYIQAPILNSVQGACLYSLQKLDKELNTQTFIAHLKQDAAHT